MHPGTTRETMVLRIQELEARVDQGKDRKAATKKQAGKFAVGFAMTVIFYTFQGKLDPGSRLL